MLVLVLVLGQLDRVSCPPGYLAYMVRQQTAHRSIHDKLSLADLIRCQLQQEATEPSTRTQPTCALSNYLGLVWKKDITKEE